MMGIHEGVNEKTSPMEIIPRVVGASCKIPWNLGKGKTTMYDLCSQNSFSRWNKVFCIFVSKQNNNVNFVSKRGARNGD